MSDDAAVFLRNAGQETRHVFKRHERNIETIAEANKASAFYRSRDIQHACKKRRLVCDHADCASTQSRKSHANVWRKHLLDFKEVTIVHDVIDHVAYIVRLVRRLRNDVVEFWLDTIDRIYGFHSRRIFKVIRRNERQQLTNDPQCMLV